MKVEYGYTKSDIRKYLFKNRIINNLILLVIGIIIYLSTTYGKISLKFLPLFIFVLTVVLIILNIIYIEIYLIAMKNINYEIYGKYTLELKGGTFIVKVNNSSTTYKYNNIKSLKEHKKYFIIKLKGTKEYLTFEKKLFKKEDYDKLLETFKKKIN